MNLSPKQKQFFYSPLRRLNFLEGSVRSGKTHVSLLRWLTYVAESPKHYEFMMTGRTMTALKRNCLNPLLNFAGASNFKFSTSQKEGTLFKRQIYFEGVNDERAESKIYGVTLGGAYCDEIVLYPEGFTTMLLSRLSQPGAALLATCNPDNPEHYIKTNYIDNPALDSTVWHFLLEDNEYLAKKNPQYLEQLKKEYRGVYYDRYIRGLWVRAEGLVFPDYANNRSAYTTKKVPDDIEFIVFGTDFGGNKSRTVFTAVGIRKDYAGFIVLADGRIEGGKGTIDPNTVNDAYVAFVRSVEERFTRPLVSSLTGATRTRVPQLKYSFADSAEQYLITGMQLAAKREDVILPRDCMKKPIKDRVLFLNRMLASERMAILDGCTIVPESLAGLMWDDKKKEDAILDEPGKTPNDGFDALSYAIERFIPYFERT